MLAAVVAGVAGACAVGAAWEGLSALEQARTARALGALAARLRATGATGWPASRRERRRVVLVGAATLLFGGWLLAGPAAGVACAAAGPWVTGQLVALRERRWRRALVADAPAVARALADALAAGHSIRSAILTVVSSGGIGAAAGRELRRCAARLALGAPTDAALAQLAQRVDCPAYDTLVAAVLLQRDAGGDVAALLRDLAAALDEAAAAQADARTATAQARLTGSIVAGLAPAGAVIVELLDPSVVPRLVSTPLSATLLGTAAVFELLALAALHRLARVR